MKKLLIGTVLVLLTGMAFGYNYGSVHSVNGYYRSSGTYVEPHMSGNPGSGIHCSGNTCY